MGQIEFRANYYGQFDTRYVLYSYDQYNKHFEESKKRINIVYLYGTDFTEMNCPKKLHVVNFYGLKVNNYIKNRSYEEAKNSFLEMLSYLKKRDNYFYTDYNDEIVSGYAIVALLKYLCKNRAFENIMLKYLKEKYNKNNLLSDIYDCYHGKVTFCRDRNKQKFD